MHQALSFSTSYQLLKSVEDKANKSCLKNERPYNIFTPLFQDFFSISELRQLLVTIHA